MSELNQDKELVELLRELSRLSNVIGYFRGFMAAGASCPNSPCCLKDLESRHRQLFGAIAALLEPAAPDRRPG